MQPLTDEDRAIMERHKDTFHKILAQASLGADTAEFYLLNLELKTGGNARTAARQDAWIAEFTDAQLTLTLETAN